MLAALAKRPFDFPTQVIARNFIISDRATLIRRQFGQTHTFPTSAMISLCTSLETKSSTECCGIDLGCKVVITVNEIPVPIDVKDDVGFSFVGDLTGMKGFGYLKLDEIPFVKFRKFSRRLVYYTWINKKIIVIGAPALEKLKIRYVPANPLELIDISDCSGKPCFDIEDTMFIEEHWVDALVKMVAPKLGIDLQEITVDEESSK